MDKIKWRTSQSFPSVGPPHYSTNSVLALPRMRVALLITSPSFAGLHSVSAQRSAVCAKVDTVLSLRAIKAIGIAPHRLPRSRPVVVITWPSHVRPLGGFAGKIVGSAARFGALHHLGWYGHPFRLPITVGSVASGIKLAQYAIEHYRYVMAATGFVTEIAIADPDRQVVPPRPAIGVHQERSAARPPHLAGRRDGGAAAPAGGQRLREVGRSPARRAHRTQAIRHVPREPSRVAARFCQFCRASSVTDGCLDLSCRFCRSVTTEIKAILSKVGWLIF